MLFALMTLQSFTCEGCGGESSILSADDSEAGYFHGGDEERRPLQPTSPCLSRLSKYIFIAIISSVVLFVLSLLTLRVT